MSPPNARHLQNRFAKMLDRSVFGAILLVFTISFSTSILLLYLIAAFPNLVNLLAWPFGVVGTLCFIWIMLGVLEYVTSKR